MRSAESNTTSRICLAISFQSEPSLESARSIFCETSRFHSKFWAFHSATMGSGGDNSKKAKKVVPGRDDYHWDTESEPHYRRRKEILKKYPEIKQLYGHCWKLKYVVSLLLAIQLSAAYYFRDVATASTVEWWRSLYVSCYLESDMWAPLR